MKQYPFFIFLLLLFTGCEKELSFENEAFEEKSTIPCDKDCPTISMEIPIAKNKKTISDSINKKVFNVIKEIVYFEEDSIKANNYKILAVSFIKSYEEMHKKFPTETFGWEAKIKGNIEFESEQILNIRLDHYTFTGGAHGYQGYRSLLFNPKTGKAISNDQLFKNEKEFKAFAEKAFRAKYQIPEKANINATGLMFENDKFQLPQNIFYTSEGLLLYYNSYEAASYADGPKDVLFSYDTVGKYLKFK
ncbi:PdaC/SigV domain-containing protein [Flavobacterium procerum]|uniref:PdaC/SigV domain-containing protein n=1 Tax=Flavobacterium procerum TaxID=1455569 RepID=A0ABV6BLH4_9FLAO